MGVAHQFLDTNGVRLHVVTAGPSDGPLVVLLHGFPEFWYGWLPQIEHLAARGYRVLAPDQRGYNTSDKPAEVAAYRLDILGEDIRGLIRAMGRTKAFLVGHDWGGAVSWWLAGTSPELIERAVVLNMPHPAVLRRKMLRDFGQLKRSWYIGLFQLPLLPERLLTQDRGARMAEMMRRTSAPGAFSDADLERYRDAWQQPGAARGMLSWYRTLSRAPLPEPPSLQLEVPLLMLWGEQDVALGPELVDLSLPYCRRGRAVRVPQATHWIHHEVPERVNAEISAFFEEEPS